MHGGEPLEERKSIKPFLVAWSIVLTFYLVVAETAAKTYSLYFGFRPFYAAGVQIRTNPAGLYDLAQQQAAQNAISPWYVLPFYHPAYEALLVAPFTLLPYHAAYLAFIVFNLTLVLGSFLLLRDVFSPTLPF